MKSFKYPCTKMQNQCNESAVYVLSGAGSKYVTRNLRMKVGNFCTCRVQCAEEGVP